MTSPSDIGEANITPKGRRVMRKVFVLDTNKQSLNPVHPGRARILLDQGKAAVYRHEPFTIILKRAVARPNLHSYRIKIDPGSRVSGIAILDENTSEVVWAAELEHRGLLVKRSLESRRALRRGRRGRKTRYRKARFDNRRRAKGWLPPSLMSRVHNIETWAKRLSRLCPLSAISVENVRFDTHVMQRPGVKGVEYQQGELWGYEVREYLLEKWQRRCAYCGKEGVPMEIEHIVPRARGGSNRVSNLAIACNPCNVRKGTQTAEEFGYPNVQKQAKAPLRDAAAVNATRWEVWRRLSSLGLPAESGTGGRTKYNRTRLGIPKAHWTDAICVGASTPESLEWEGIVPLAIKAMGHGNRQICRTDKFGFPTKHRQRTKQFMDYRTGDLVKAVRPSGDSEAGRVTIRQRPSFTLNGKHVHPKYLTKTQSADGYKYG